MEGTLEESILPKPNRQEIRRFSKQSENGRNSRKNVASQIVEGRKELSNPILMEAVDLINEASIIVSDPNEDANLRKESFIGKAQQIEENDWKKADRLSSYIDDILEFVASGQMNRETRDLKSLPDKIRSLLNLDEMLLRAVSDLGTRLKEELRRNHKDILRRFYKHQEYRLNVLKGDHYEGNQIGEVSTSYNVIFVHGVEPKLGGNTDLLKKEADRQAKFNILFGFNPSISASSIREGDNRKYNMWAGIGVIVSGGTIMQASPVDFGSHADSLHERVVTHGLHASSISDQIKLAISDRPGAHNEFIVNDPKFAGIYVVPHDEEDFVDKDRDNLIHQIATDLQVPVYVIYAGQVYNSQFSKDSEGNYSAKKIGNPISPQELIGRNYIFPEDKKAQAKRKGLEFLNVPETAGVR